MAIVMTVAAPEINVHVAPIVASGRLGAHHNVVGVVPSVVLPVDNAALTSAPANYDATISPAYAVSVRVMTNHDNAALITLKLLNF